MSKVLEAEELSKKFERWRPKFVGIVNEAAQENRLTAKRKKEKMDKLIGEVERSGEDVSAFRDAMLFLDHVDDALAVRAELAGKDGNQSQLEMFDRQVLAANQGLGLFDGGAIKQMKDNAKSAAKALEEPEAPPTAAEDAGEEETEVEEDRKLRSVQ